MVQQFEHWIAFALLSLIGANMIKESFSKKEDKNEDNPFNFLKMLVLAIATSIDALALGVTFVFQQRINAECLLPHLRVIPVFLPYI